MKSKSTSATLDLNHKSENHLVTRFESVRQQSESLAADLSSEDCMVQSMPDASPTKWHLAHTTWFWETFLLTPHLQGYKPLDPEYRTLFNSYYNAVGDKPQRDTRGSFSRPSLDEVFAYRQYVDQFMLQLLHNHLPQELSDIITLGLNHEQQHQELIVTDIKHALWSNPLRPAYAERSIPENGEPARQQWLEYGEGLYHIGHDGAGFAFDNETPRHKVWVEDFQLASRLITNAEYMQFMLDGGYRRPELWVSEGWDTVLSQGWKAPLYWERRNDDVWWNYTLQGMRPVDLDEPVCHVSYFEADAFARWAGDRLPTEAEWEVAAAKPAEATPIGGNFLESGNFHPVSTSHKNGDPDTVLRQMFGDCWEWTQSSYSAYPGYRPAAGALGEYNGKFMCNQYVLRGGSCATPQTHIRASYRNFFPARARWQFSGIRLAKDVL